VPLLPLNHDRIFSQAKAFYGRPWGGVVLVLALILAVYGLFLFSYAHRFGGNVTGFACIGDLYPAPGFQPQGAFVLPKSDGYDGQFFLTISLDPLMTKGAAQYIDAPGYRYQRILYPWLARLAALGRPQWVPWTLVLVNLAAVLAGSLFTILIGRRFGLGPWTGLLYGFLNGLLLGVLRDLAEPTAMALMTAGIYFYLEGRPGRTALCLAAGLLAKEVVALAAGPLLLHALFWKRDKVMALALGAAFIPTALWGLIIYWRLGEVAYLAGGGNLGPPLKALLAYLGRLLSGALDWRNTAYGLTFVGLTLVSLVLGVRELLRSRDGLSLPFLVWAVFPFFLTAKVWVEPWSYARVTLPLAVFLVLNYLKTRDRLYLLPISGHLALFGFVLWWQKVI